MSASKPEIVKGKIQVPLSIHWYVAYGERGTLHTDSRKAAMNEGVNGVYDVRQKRWIRKARTGDRQGELNP